MITESGWPQDDGAASALAVASTAFVIWMAVDAIRRRAPLYWLAAIVLIRPLGGVAYFFFVKIRDYRTRTGALHGEPTSRWWHGAWRLGGAATLDPAELAAADALEVAGRYADAIPLYQAVLARTPRHLQALHGLGRCMLGVGNPGRAVQLLGEVLSEDTSFGNYSAALEYAEALWQAGQHQDCLRVLERMVGATGRINHRIALAHYAMLSELPSRAREVLEQALAAHASAPDTVRRRQQQWANRATHMLASLRVV